VWYRLVAMTYEPHCDQVVELVRQAMASAVAKMVSEPQMFADPAAANRGAVVAELGVFKTLAESFVAMRSDLIGALGVRSSSGELARSV
jgi:hypothetical protein